MSATTATPTAPPTIVIGLGRSGVGAARLLQAQGHRVVLLESRQTPLLEEKAAGLAREGMDVRLGVPLADATFAALDTPPALVVVSPGIRWDHSTLVNLRQQGVRVVGELAPAWQASCDVPWIGITGTNGKTTVAHLVHHLLRQGGLDAPLCGNVGISAAEVALQRLQPGRPRPDRLVVEISSYQIEANPGIAPAIGVWTTLTPDHLERHGTLDAYRAIKRQLLEKSAVRILNADDADLRARSDSWDHADWITAGPRRDLPAGLEPRLWVEDGIVQAAPRPGCRVQGALFAADCLAMPGAHNRQNLLMATAVGLHCGLEAEAMAEAFRRFPGVPHRLERIREHQGVVWYNDSKATNFDAAEVALKALDGPLVVLAGGQAKQGDASGWLQELDRQAVAVVLYGEARSAFTALLEGAGYGGRISSVEGLAAAVTMAAELAERHGSRGVLLSPACASFDQYSDFEARGDHFRQLVQAL